MPAFGSASTARLQTLCPEMVDIAYDAILSVDYSVIQTARGQAEQNRYFQRGMSKVKWPNSKHNVYESRPLAEAMDLWPYVRPFGALSGHPDQIKAIARETGKTRPQVREFVYKAYARMAGAVQACAVLRGHTVRWGGDWDRDGNLLDQKFNDLAHFELVRPRA